MLLDFWRETRISSRVVTGSLAPLELHEGSLERELGIAIWALSEKTASSLIDGGISWIFSSCGGRLGIPLQVPRGSQGASCVASGKSSLYLSCEMECRIALESRQVNEVSIRMEGRISRCFLRCGRKFGCPRVATGT